MNKDYQHAKCNHDVILKNKNNTVRCFPRPNGEDQNEVNIKTYTDKIDNQTKAPAKTPKSLQKAKKTAEASRWDAAWNTELNRRDTELRTWADEHKLSGDRHLPCLMDLKAKENIYGGLERF